MPAGGERDEIWRAYQTAFVDNDEPGTYVPFLSMEMHPLEGDRTLVFRESAEIPMDMRSEVKAVYDTYGDGTDSLLEVHLGGSVPKYGGYEPEEERLVEVCSAFGNAEWLLQRLLQSGYHPAITGASDLHLGLLGAPRAVETFRGRFGYHNSILSVRDSGFGSGPLGAILAEDCLRGELWSALLARHGYATSGDRIYLRLDAGGHRMGEIANLGEDFDVRLEVHGESPVERIDLIVGTSLARSWFPATDDVDLAFRFDRRVLPSGRWFYFRILQQNWEYAWTAPLWYSDGEEMGDSSRAWPAWNHTQEPPRARGSHLEALRGDLERYLGAHGDRASFGELVPLGVFGESMGRAARFASRTQPDGHPVILRWYYEMEFPRIRVDWGFQNFGVVNCEDGPAGSGFPVTP